jgi:ornithine carbamoyltransferase
MPLNLKGRSLLTLKDYSPREISYLIDLSARLKHMKYTGVFSKSLKDKNVALIFEKPSTRTRCAFVVACVDEGAHPEYLGKNDIQMGKKESVADTARVLGRMFDGIQFRGFEHSTVEELAKYAGVPVWNGLTDSYHPTQVLADLLTVREKFGSLRGRKLVYAGDGRNNVANSLLVGCAKMGVDIVITAPESLFPDDDLARDAQEYARQSGSSIEFTSDVVKAVSNADAIYTDVWVSMGEEDNPGMKERIESLRPYQVNAELMAATGRNDTIFMHCLPAVHNNEVTTEVFESSASVVFDEAENRVHTIKAVMVSSL